MGTTLSLRKWATPLTIGSFVLMSATGVIMFFDWEPGQTTIVHQWFSWIFLAGTGSHILIHLRPFKQHVKSRWGLACLAAIAIIHTASFFSWGLISGPRLKGPIEEALVDAPLSALAAATHADPAELIARLALLGYETTEQASIRELVTAYGVDENEILGIIFLAGSKEHGS